MTIQNFEDIKAWQKARELTDLIYSYTRKTKFSKDFARFLYHSKKSAAEVRCQLYVALDQDYIGKEEFTKAFNLSLEISKMTASLIKYLYGNS